jgi:hypothetical protein
MPASTRFIQAGKIHITIKYNETLNSKPTICPVPTIAQTQRTDSLPLSGKRDREGRTPSAGEPSTPLRHNGLFPINVLKIRKLTAKQDKPIRPLPDSQAHFATPRIAQRRGAAALREQTGDFFPGW